MVAWGIPQLFHTLLLSEIQVERDGMEISCRVKPVWLVIGVCTLLLLSFPVSQGYTQSVVLGALPGERLKFNVQWYGVPAGEAFMEMRAAKPGKYSLIAGVKTIGLVKFMHPLSDQLMADGLLSASGMSTRYYIKQQLRGRKNRLIKYHFDRKWEEAIQNQKGEFPFEIGGVLPGVNDMLTGFYTLRACARLRPGATIYLPMLDGQKIYYVLAEVGQPERLNTPLGWFDVLRLTVTVENSELFRTQGKIVVWLTNDARRMPVRVESRIDYKRVAADLFFFEDGRGGRKSLKEMMVSE